jgi:type IV secretory pathway VirB10-like protein
MTTTPPVTETPQPSAAATPVTDKRTPATGAIPKQMQSWILLAIMGVVAVGLWFSSSGQKAKNASANGPAGEQARPMVGGLSPEEVQRRLQESEDARRTALSNPTLNQSGPPADAHVNQDAASGGNQPAQPATPAVDPIAEDERKREYVSRFASNIALSYRTDPHASSPGPMPPANVLGGSGDAADTESAVAPPQNLPGLPANFQQQLEALQAQQEKLLAQQQQLATAAALPAGAPAQQPAQAPAPAASTHKNVDVNAATGKEHVIFEGTVLESVLVNRLNSDFAGPVLCQITNDVYSHDHSQLLIPAGTRVLGETKKVSDIGQARLAVVFHRLIMPDGYAVDLDQAPGLNQIGETALKDKVNNHYFRIFGASIAVGAISGLATIGSNNSAATGLPTSPASAYQQGVAGSLSQSSLRILDKFLNIPPTITIREGHRVRIYLTQDLQVPAYAQHKMPSDL